MKNKRKRRKFDPSRYIGKKFGQLTVLSVYDTFHTTPRGAIQVIRMAHCLCDCGKEYDTQIRAIENGHTISCGHWNTERYEYYRNEFLNNRLLNIPKGLYKHGLSNHPLYKKYDRMVRRCYDPNDKHYIFYGYRGIYIEEPWYFPNDFGAGFINFYNWAINNGWYEQPKDTPIRDRLSIERKHVDGPYAPWNCEWIPLWQQQSNLTTTRYIYDGNKWYTYANICKKYNVPPHFVHSRLKCGWTPSEVIFALNNPNLGLHLDKVNDGILRDKDGFMHLIPKIQEDTSTYEYKQEKKHRDNDNTYHNNRNK